MTYLDDYKARINTSGKNLAESQFNTTARFIEISFADSPFYRVVKVNGTIDLEVQLQDINAITRSADVQLVQNVLKFMLLKPNNTVDIGDLVELDGQFWMVTDFISDNPLFPKAKIGKCNSTYPIKLNKSKVIIGYYDNGKPQWDEVYQINNDDPCIVMSVNGTINTNSQIVTSNVSLSISLQYKESDTFAENYEFTMYGNKYKVKNIDYSFVINEKGIIKIIAERV
jgi:hypothetical protein